MFIEYKVKFGHNEVTVAQCIEVDALTSGESDRDRPSDDAETTGTVVAEKRLRRAALPGNSADAVPIGAGGPGDHTRGTAVGINPPVGGGNLPIGGGPGDHTRGAGPGDHTRGTGPGDHTRGSGVIVLGPVIINFPPPPPPAPPANKD